MTAQAGFDAADLIADVTELPGTRFFEPAHNLFIEGWDRGWTASADNHGQNPNVHLVEAFIAASLAAGGAASLAAGGPAARD